MIEDTTKQLIIFGLLIIIDVMIMCYIRGIEKRVEKLTERLKWTTHYLINSLLKFQHKNTEET